MKLHPASEKLFQTDEGVEKAKKAAFRLLSGRAYTRWEILEKLKARGFIGPVIDETIVALEELRLIDDADFARRFVQEKIRLRPMGRPMLKKELKRRGISNPELVEEVLDDAFTEVDPEELALGLLRGRKSRYSSLDRQKALSRMCGFLGRRGFSGSDARSAVERAWAEFTNEEEQ